ncbi:hypothetical protein ACSBR2_025577 [Camellia fascicularis]
MAFIITSGLQMYIASVLYGLKHTSMDISLLVQKSTQRCESMNAFFNRFLKVRLRLFEFVRAYDRALARLRHNEAKAQSKTENTTPTLSTEDVHVYYLSMYTHPESPWNVQYRPSDHAMKRSCLHFESCGIPCSHIVSIMKMEHLKEIPSSCILQR